MSEYGFIIYMILMITVFCPFDIIWMVKIILKRYRYNVTMD